jgi:hypothetical protein
MYSTEDRLPRAAVVEVHERADFFVRKIRGHRKAQILAPIGRRSGSHGSSVITFKSSRSSSARGTRPLHCQDPLLDQWLETRRNHEEPEDVEHAHGADVPERLRNSDPSGSGPLCERRGCRSRSVSRTKVMESLSPGRCSRTAPTRSSAVCIVFPSTETLMSPGFSPASCSGLLGSTESTTTPAFSVATNAFSAWSRL